MSLIQKIKCWIGMHKPIMVTNYHEMTQTVFCKHCGKIFICTDWGKFKWED